MGWGTRASVDDRAKGAVAAHGDRQAEGRHEGLRYFAAPLGGTLAFVTLASVQPASGGLPGSRLISAGCGAPVPVAGGERLLWVR